MVGQSLIRIFRKLDSAVYNYFMEVHHHSHTARKKWNHYVWEFLMLFLAVFCGFLAENQREHYIEHQREKQYVRSFIEDLKSDTAELKKGLAGAAKSARYCDTLLRFLQPYIKGDRIPTKVTNLNQYAVPRLLLIFTDRTSSQLKNAGAMRLIRNKEVADGLVDYWKQIEETKNNLDRYLDYRERQRELTFKLVMIPEVTMYSREIPLDSISDVPIINKDQALWSEFLNLVAMCRRILSEAHKRSLEAQLQKATSLIALIKEEYNVK